MKPQIYVDFGAGFVPVNECDAKLVFDKTNIEFVRQRTNLSGEITFWSAAFTYFTGLIDTDEIEIPIKVYIDTVLQGTYFMSLFGNIDNNRKTITFNNFTENSIYSEIEQNLDNEYQLFEDDWQRRWNNEYYLALPISQEVFEILSGSTIYADDAEYILHFTIEGTAKLITDPDTRWDYFSLVSTTPLGGGLYQHKFSTYYSPVPAPGFDVVIYDNTTKYFSASAPGNTEISLNIHYESVNYVLSRIAVLLGLESTVNCTYLDLNFYVLAPMARVLFTALQETENNTKITANQVFNMMRNVWQLEWFVNDNNELTFYRSTDFGSGGTTDVSIYDTHNKVNTYAAESTPKSERLNFANKKDDVKIEYTRNTSDQIIYDNGLFTVDIVNTLQNKETAQNTGFLLCKVTHDMSTAIDSVVFIDNNNAELQPAYLLETHFLNWRYAAKGKINNVEKTFTKRPMFTHAPIILPNVLPSNMNLQNEFVTSDGTYFGAKYSYDCETAQGTLTLVK